jgi:DNA-binding CsgD family transcriptional regulator
VAGDVGGELVRDVDVLGPGSNAPSAEMPSVDSAVCWLLQTVQEAGGVEPLFNPAGNQILLDMTVGDVRCLLIRHGHEEFEGHHARLSPREEQIARMVARGFTNKTIARVLEISLWTVSTHLRRVFAKLGVSTRAAMVARLLADDILPVCGPGGCDRMSCPVEGV